MEAVLGGDKILRRCTASQPTLARSRSQTLVLSASCSGSASSPAPRRQAVGKTQAASVQASAVAAVPTKQFASFDDMIAESDVPVLVDFYAPWCGPCTLMSRVISDLSREMKGAMNVVKIDTDKYPKLASKYRVQALPTCMLFRDGKPVDRVEGFMPEPSFGKRIRFYVSRLDAKFGRR